MTITIPLALSVIVAIIGAIAYFVSSNAKVAEVGRILFFAGVLAFLLTYK